MLVQDFLEDSATRLPNKVGLVCGDRRLTYAEIDAQANRLANALISRGFRRGDRCVICAPNCAEAVVGIFAALKANGVFVVLNPGVKPDKLLYILNNCQAAALLADTRPPIDWREVTGRVPSLKIVIGLDRRAPPDWLRYADALAAADACRPPRVNIDLDLACLVYTSGSTGEPKGVMSDHANVVFAAGAIIDYLGNTENDVIIDALPLAFDYGLYQVLMTFKFGGRLVLEAGCAYPAALLKRIEAERVTGLPGVPTLFAVLLELDLDAFDLSSLRYLTNTAAALPVEHIRRLREKFPHATLFSMYGLTETKRTLYLPPDQLDRRPGSVGIAIPGTEVWLEDEQGHRLGPDQVGELVVRGRHVMRGYWQDPIATAQRFRPGPLPGERVCHTGDLFRMDADGYFYFVGRRDDIIKTRGEKVAPKEVENVLYALPGVVEAAVVGVPDPVLGQAIKAVIVTRRADLTAADVLRHCRAHLEDFMIPKYVDFCDELPKTASGKINKTALN